MILEHLSTVGNTILQAVTQKDLDTWFSPFAYIVYLGTLLVGMILYYEWTWARICKENVLVLLQKSDGHGDFQLAPQDGGSVSLRNPHTDTTRMWPMNDLSTIDVPYPGVGFVPVFLQKSIRLVIVDEDDWEPVLNRGAYQSMVASPDVTGMLKEVSQSIMEKSPDIAKRIDDIVSGLSTASTREMIASPAVLGNLMHEKITEAVITVNREMLESVAGMMRKISNILSNQMFYIGTGLIIITLVFLGYLLVSMSPQIILLSAKLDAIIKATGAVPPPVVP